VEGQFTLANDPEEAGDDLNSQLLPGRAAIAEAGRRATGEVRNRRSPATGPAVDGAADTVGEFTPRGRAHADSHVVLIDDPERREPEPNRGLEHTSDIADLRRDRIAAQKCQFGAATTVTQ
jgi:hypothetical protein